MGPPFQTSFPLRTTWEVFDGGEGAREEEEELRGERPEHRPSRETNRRATDQGPVTCGRGLERKKEKRPASLERQLRHLGRHNGARLQEDKRAPVKRDGRPEGRQVSPKRKDEEG